MSFPTNGGWVFRQPQSGWVNPAAMIGESASIDAIRRHRLANPAIVAKHKLSTDPAEIGRELIAFQRARGALPPEQLPATSFFAHHSSLPARVVAVAAEIKTAAHGAAAILDFWNSKEPPVEKALAERRAEICAACPQNGPGAWFIEAPSELIRKALASRGDLKLETPSDDKLQSCQVCKCLMKLKVWIGLDFILNHTKPEVMDAFPKANCWIAKRDA